MTPRIKAAAAAAVIAIIGGVYYGNLHPVLGPTGGQVSVPWPNGTMPSGARCFWIDCNAGRSALQIFGLDTEVGDAGPLGSRYVRARIGAVPGNDDSAELPDGLDCVDDTATTDFDCPANANQLDAWVAGELADPNINPCACGTGCQWRRDPQAAWEPGIPGVSYRPGQWQGADAGCFMAACVELSGSSSLPLACK